MTTDDNVADLDGQVLTKIEITEGEGVKGTEEQEEWGEEHEVVFLSLITQKETFTFCTHNEHNGYYGGFSLTIKELSDKRPELMEK